MRRPWPWPLHYESVNSSSREDGRIIDQEDASCVFEVLLKSGMADNLGEFFFFLRRGIGLQINIYGKVDELAIG
jgi:hypothetical protein